MKREDRTLRTGWFVLSVVLGVVALSIIPPFEIFGMLTSKVDVLSELRGEALAMEEPMEYTADIERLEHELATMAVDSVAIVDTLPEPPTARYEWILEPVPSREHVAICSDALSYDPERGVVPIENFDTLQGGKFEKFISKLANGEDVRIAFMGDSFIEGDILTSDFRAIMQEKFGGRGVGFVACDIPFGTVRKSVKRSSTGWTAYSVMKPKTLPERVKDKFFVSGYLAEGRSGATTRWSSTDAFPTLDSCSRARVLLYSRDSSRVVVEVNDSLRQSFDIEGADILRELYVEAPISSLRLRVDSGNVLCYGASLEGNGGVQVDNFSVRSNNGHAIFGTSAKINRQADDMLHYDLVVLQYGLNIMQKGQRGYSRYRDQLRDMIAYAERCFPRAAIVVMGVSDRWVKNEESTKYEPIGSVDALSSYQRAAADSTNVAFWATAKAMERLGGMPKFVANGWAAKDYTHINFYGGKRIAEELAEAIISEVYALVMEREAEAQRLEALERERKEAIERQVQMQMNSVMPLIEGMQITINK